jgi:hypothetical protein
MKKLDTLLGTVIVIALITPASQATSGPMVTTGAAPHICTQAPPSTAVVQPPGRLGEQIWRALARVRQFVIGRVCPDPPAEATGTRVRKQMQKVKQAAQVVRNRVLEIRSAQ